jgi:glycosyltransferase involved in cell wall biosynthesis
VSKRISVLHVSNQLGLGGTDATLHVLAAHLNRKYFDVFAAGVQAGGPRERSLQDLGIPTVVAYGDFDVLSELIQIQHIDIVHLHHCYVPLRLLRNCHVVLTHQFSRRVYQQQDEFQLSRLLFNSSRTLQKYLRTYRIGSIPSNAEIVYNPIDLAEISRVQSTLTDDVVAAYRQSLGIEAADFVIGRLGRSDVVKWSDFLIEACRPMLRADRNFKLLLQTAPPSRVKRLADEFGRAVIVLPESASLRDLALFFAAIDVYAHSSKIGESFGVSIAEAMAYRKPVVVNSTPSADNAQIELVDNGTTGFVVDYPVSFARALETLRANRQLRMQMGEAGFNKVITKYAAGVVTGQYERLLFEVMGRADEPDVRDYVNSLAPRLTRDEMQRGFDEYQRRLTETFGVVSGHDRIAYWMRSPARLATRVGDRLEYVRQVRAQRSRSLSDAREPDAQSRSRTT